MIYDDLFIFVENWKRNTVLNAMELSLFLTNSCLFLYSLLQHRHTKNINVNVLQLEKRDVSNAKMRVKDDSHLDVKSYWE